MASFTGIFRPLSSRSGFQITTPGAAIGTGGVAAVASSTAAVHIPVPRRKCKLVSLQAIVKTAAAGGGAITAQAFKRDNVGTPADRTLTATCDLTATQFTTLDKGYAIPITGTEAQTIFQPGDTLRIDIVCASTVTTQPQVVIVAEFAILA